MSGKYGFTEGIKLPSAKKTPVGKHKPTETTIKKAVTAGKNLGFVDREPQQRLKPGPKQKEPQDKISIPGPKRVIHDYRQYCLENDLTLWQGLEQLLLECQKDARK